MREGFERGQETGSTDRWRRNTNAKTVAATLPKSEDIDDLMSYNIWRTDWMSLRKESEKWQNHAKGYFQIYLALSPDYDDGIQRRFCSAHFCNVVVISRKTDNKIMN